MEMQIEITPCRKWKLYRLACYLDFAKQWPPVFAHYTKQPSAHSTFALRHLTAWNRNQDTSLTKIATKTREMMIEMKFNRQANKKMRFLLLPASEQNLHIDLFVLVLAIRVPLERFAAAASFGTRRKKWRWGWWQPHPNFLSLIRCCCHLFQT